MDVLCIMEKPCNTLTEKIISFMRRELPVQPLINFLKNMMKNPSFASRRELFDFLSLRVYLSLKMVASWLTRL